MQTVPWIPYHPHKVNAFLGWIDPTPRLIRETFSPEMARRIQAILSTERIDLVIASQLGTASYRGYFRNLPGLFEEVELGVYYEKFESAASLGEKIRNGLTLVKHRRYLASLLRDYQACSVASDREKHLLSQVAPAYKSVEVIPNFLDLTDYNDINVFPQPNSLIFTGPFSYYVNYEAMCWFLDNVFPKVLEKIPDVKLVITGDHAGCCVQ